MYLIDTDRLIDYLAGAPTVRSLILLLLPNGLAMSVITFMELYEGVEASATGNRDERALRALVRDVRMIPVDRRVAREAARVRAYLRANRLAVRRRALDLLIASTALVHDLTLVTANRHDYADIPNLRIY